jgi:hypothetical protein
MFSDGLNMLPRPGEPESALEPGMGAPRSPVGEPFGVTPLSMPDTSGPGPTATQAPAAWVYDFDPANGSSRATFNGEVLATSITAPGSGVASFNTRTGAVVLTTADITGAGGAVAASPAFTGNPTAPTQAPGDADTSIATTAFVAQAIANNPAVASFNGRTGPVTLTAGDVTGAGGITNPNAALAGVPTAPTASQGTQTSQIASTMFVANAIASSTVSSWNGRQGGVVMSLSDVISVGGAPIASPNFTGTPTGPTPTVGDASQRLATTAFVTNAVTAGASGVASFNTRTGAVTLQLADVVGVGGAPLASPNLTGVPTAPTPTGGDSSTKLATTAFVTTAIGGLPPGVATFNGRQGTVTLNLPDVTSVGGAPIASPTFTGSPLSTTPAPADNSTRVATTAFVAAAIAPLATSASLPVVATTVPLIDGTATIGASGKWADGAHVHPTDTSRAAQSSLANYLPLAGGTLTGLLNGTQIALSGNIQAGTVTSMGQCFFSFGNVNDFLAVAVSPNRQIQFAGGGAGATLNLNSATGMFTWNWASSMMFQSGPDGTFTIAGGSAIKPGGGSWTATSDARIKTVQADYLPGLNEVTALDPVVYRYKGNDTYQEGQQSPHQLVATSNTDFVGLIAQDVELVFPGMVTKSEGWIDGVKVDDMRTLDTSPLIYALVNAVKELAARVEQLEAGV